MTSQAQQKTLDFLYERGDEGAVLEDIRKACGMKGKHQTEVIVSNLFGVYIDRWVLNKNETDYEAVYCLVDVPENCPKPEKPNVELTNGRRIATDDPHAAYLFDRRIHRLTVDERGIDR